MTNMTSNNCDHVADDIYARENLCGDCDLCRRPITPVFRDCRHVDVVRCEGRQVLRVKIMAMTFVKSTLISWTTSKPRWLQLITLIVYSVVLWLTKMVILGILTAWKRDLCKHRAVALLYFFFSMTMIKTSSRSIFCYYDLCDALCVDKLFVGVVRDLVVDRS